MRGRPGGATLVEALIALALVASAFLVLVSVFAVSARQAAHTRGALLATMLVQSMMEEAAAHTYGSPAPPGWAGREVVVPVWIQGRPAPMTFQVRMESVNGSFVGLNAHPDTDQLKITVTWQEASARGGPVTRQAEAEMTVWREHDTNSPF